MDGVPGLMCIQLIKNWYVTPWQVSSPVFKCNIVLILFIFIVSCFDAMLLYVCSSH